ncbi:MAG: threonine/serine dehydratase [Pseudomonadota bacterium]
MLDRARLPADIALAAHRIQDLVRLTPLEESPYYSEATKTRVLLKQENLQLTSSFKIRGATNKLKCLPEEALGRGCVAASSGNHGAAVAHALRRLNARGVVFVPEGTSETKVSAIEREGAEVRVFGSDGLDTETEARRFSGEAGMPYLSPYNDPDVIAGQGSVGVEIARQCPEVDAVFIAVGGGGLIGGVGAFLKSVRPDIRIVSCQPEASAVMTESIRAGHLLDLPSDPTLSDGTAGGIEADSLTFELCRDVIDDFVIVDEEAIADAMRTYIDAHHQLIEGAAGVAIAGLLAKASDYRDATCVVVVCGGNVSRKTLRQVI